MGASPTEEARGMLLLLFFLLLPGLPKLVRRARLLLLLPQGEQGEGWMVGAAHELIGCRRQTLEGVACVLTWRKAPPRCGPRTRRAARARW